MNRHWAIPTLLALVGCESPFVPPPVLPPPPPTVASVQVTPDSATVVAGDTLPLTATLRDSTGQALSGRPVTWRTADTLIASVTFTGVVHGINVGHATIRASANGHADSVTVFVTPIFYHTVSTGGALSCATANNQHVYCWGDNADGRTGTASGALQEPTPRPIADATPYAAVAAGGDHACALTPSGIAACWGRNDQGQLGRGAATGDPARPAPVVTGLRFATLAAGSAHTCGLATDGDTYCWGLDVAGQLGDGGTVSRDSPRRVVNDTPFIALAAGANHTCGLTASGEASCWGANALGQLGDGSRNNRATAASVIGGPALARLSAGGAHTCGLTSTGDAFCWGADLAGQLGTGVVDTFALTPRAVMGGFTFRVLAAGGAHTCGLTTDSLAYCWGNNEDGELGNGSTSSLPTASPVPVNGGLRFADLRAGASHTCGITAALVIYCWGLGLQGQLGQVIPHSSAVPVRVAGQP
jgi:alpha-tubulin suppressor-like RCC1 family protein